METTALDDHSAAQYNGLTSGEYVKLTVKDNGSGIDPKLIGLIFDPYFTTKDVDKGLGMGLAVVYGIVKKHDGAIRVNSKVGKGTTVEVLFPVTKETAQIEKDVSKDLARGTERILFVDDEASLVKMVTQMLERQGYEVVGKTSSNEALKLFQAEANKFALVITDIAMPEMPGDRLAQELIRIRPTIPIIICTGHSDRMDEGKAMKLGIAAYVMKPLVKTDLVNTVRGSWINQKIRLDNYNSCISIWHQRSNAPYISIKGAPIYCGCWAEVKTCDRFRISQPKSSSKTW